MQGVNVAGVQFRRAGKIYDFLTAEIGLRIGDEVVVDTERGPAIAEVVKLKFVDKQFLGATELKNIVRKASAKDLDNTGKLTPEDARAYAQKRVRELGLEMNILKAELQFGGNKIILYFSAPGRIDFRELVKQLAGGLKARVELKQIGARDETKIMGGIGICGREYCCSSFLREFVPVSIKMAKNQNLALNPVKVSGGCGRLLCCLTYENDVYSELRLKLPPRGARVQLADQSYGDVLQSDLLNQICLIENDQGQQVKVPVSELIVVANSDKKPVPQDGEWGEDLDLKKLMEKVDD